MADMASVWAEWDRFNTELPGLLKQSPGRWVIFRSGKAEKDFATEDEAYSEAVERYGPTGGFIVAQVTKDTPALVLFGAAQTSE